MCSFVFVCCNLCRLNSTADHGTSFKYTVVSTIFLFLMALMQILEGLWHKSTHYVFHTALVPANDEKKGDGSGGSGRGKVSAQAGHRGAQAVGC